MPIVARSELLLGLLAQTAPSSGGFGFVFILLLIAGIVLSIFKRVRIGLALVGAGFGPFLALAFMGQSGSSPSDIQGIIPLVFSLVCGLGGHYVGEGIERRKRGNGGSGAG